MKYRHTPGPWHVLKFDDVALLVCAEDRSANDEWEIATPHGPDFRANAHLIAAAPELAAACRAFLAACEDAARIYGDQMPATGGMVQAALAARTALAKAEGAP
jgi:hypothetical protein